MRVQSGSGIVRSQPTASRAQSSIHQYAMTAASHADGLFKWQPQAPDQIWGFLVASMTWRCNSPVPMLESQQAYRMHVRARPSTGLIIGSGSG